MGLILRESSIHASGCYTTSPIKKKTFIVEYTGPHISKKRADDLYENARRTYLFGLDDGRHVVDGTGIAAFINHSCVPNCETDEVDGQIWIIALRDIKAGEELTYDYNLYDGDDDDRAACRCGARGCRGAMYSEEELAKRAKAAPKTRQAKNVATRRALSADLAPIKRRADAARLRTRNKYTGVEHQPEPFRKKR